MWDLECGTWRILFLVPSSSYLKVFLFYIRCSTDIAISERMRIVISAFFAFCFESLTTSYTAEVFFWIQSIAVVTSDKIGSTSFSSRYHIFFVGKWSNKKINRQSYKWRQKCYQQNTNDLQTKTACSVDDIFCSPYNSHDSQKYKKNRHNIYSQSSTARAKYRRQAP